MKLNSVFINHRFYLWLKQVWILVFASSVALLFYPTYVLADLVITAPPRESQEDSQRIYAPIAKHLTLFLGTRVSYVRAQSWQLYYMDMRKDKYDIILDDPHFVAWRIKYLQHIPAVKLPSTLSYLVIVHSGNEKIFELRDLFQAHLCGIAANSLSTSVILSQYVNPVFQPELITIKGDFYNVFQAFERGQCQAAVIRNKIYASLSQHQKAKIKIIFKTIELPNLSMSVSKRVSDTQRRIIVDTLTSEPGIVAAEHFFSRYSTDAPYFVPANKEDFANLEKILEGNVWGW